MIAAFATPTRTFWCFLSFAVFSTGVVAGCGGPSEGLGPPTSSAQSNIDVRRSLVVTELPILARFSFQRVLDQLVAQSGVAGMTSLQLFHQWWDTQNPTPGLYAGRHCDSQVDIHGNPILNTYPYACRPAATNQEGIQATDDPFKDFDSNPAAYIPIGLFNRFDLAPADGAHCGEHRIVYARRSGITDATNRNLIIFEATLPNPHLDQGLKGCQKIARFWADLSKKANVEDRAALLEQFYFDGIAEVSPVVSFDHYGGNADGLGQIRTNQFLQAGTTPRSWNLREFKLISTCSGGTCTDLQMVPVSAKSNPFGQLFSLLGSHVQTVPFQQDFVTSQVSRLAAATVEQIDMKIDDVFNTGQSLANSENNYVGLFGTGPTDFHAAIQSVLTTLGSTLSPGEIVGRAQALSCAGCHRLNANPNALGVPAIGGGLVWPSSLGFTHVTENATESVEGVPRFVISPALLTSFLPVRKTVLDDFMNDKPPNTNDPHDPIGGRRTH